jgi:actin related protein 2/3 complex subunit 4
MSASLAPYLDRVRVELETGLAAMEDQPLESPYPIRPIVELKTGQSVKERTIRHSSKEYCLLESSTNSLRLSLSFKQAQGDSIDQAILSKYTRFFQQRAERYTILRRKAVPGYSISFLVTNTHVANFGGNAILEMILDFIAQVDRECSHVKISVNARARFVATEFLKSF